MALGIPAIARELGVRHILEGSVRKAGETIRIAAQLIDVGADKHLWSDTHDRTLTAENIFSIQTTDLRFSVTNLSLTSNIAALDGPMARTLSARVKSEIGGGAAAKEGQPGMPR
jgi:hypothetical protein